MAYFPKQLAKGLYLHSPGRKPKGHIAQVFEYFSYFSCKRPMARHWFPLYCMGASPWLLPGGGRASHAGKELVRKSVPG